MAGDVSQRHGGLPPVLRLACQGPRTQAPGSFKISRDKKKSVIYDVLNLNFTNTYIA